MRTILPAAFNDIIGMAKGTSNVYIVAIPELFYTVQVIFHRNLEVISLLMVATVWYLVIRTVLSIIQWQVERHFARGALRTQPSIISRDGRRTSRSGGKNSRARRTRRPAQQVEVGRTRTDAAPKSRSTACQENFGALKVLDNDVFELRRS